MHVSENPAQSKPDRGRHHPELKSWNGPGPNALQHLLLRACLAPQPEALDAWCQWLAQCDFNSEDSRSIELASLAVSRLGKDAGQGSEATRCRGWNRRAWFLSEVAKNAANQIAKVSRQFGRDIIVTGDLATNLAGYTFAGREFPIRSINLTVSNDPAFVNAIRELFQGGTCQALAAEAIHSGHLPLSVRTVPHQLNPQARPLADLEGLKILEPAEHIVWLARCNWQRHPPGGLRWILEILSMIQRHGDDAELGHRVAAEAQRQNHAASVLSALRLIATLPDSSAVGPLVKALEDGPISIRSRIKRWRHTSRAGTASLRMERWIRGAR